MTYTQWNTYFLLTYIEFTVCLLFVRNFDVFVQAVWWKFNPCCGVPYDQDILMNISGSSLWGLLVFHYSPVWILIHHMYPLRISFHRTILPTINLMWFWPASSLICGNKMPTRCNRGFYCRSYCLLNIFRAPLCPSSGAQEYYTVVAACGISCCKNVNSNL